MSWRVVLTHFISFLWWKGAVKDFKKVGTQIWSFESCLRHVHGRGEGLEQKVISLEHRGTRQGDRRLHQTRKGSRFFRGLDGSLLLASYRLVSFPSEPPAQMQRWLHLSKTSSVSTHFVMMEWDIIEARWSRSRNGNSVLCPLQISSPKWPG